MHAMWKVLMLVGLSVALITVYGGAASATPAGAAAAALPFPTPTALPSPVPRLAPPRAPRPRPTPIPPRPSPPLPVPTCSPEAQAAVEAARAFLVARLGVGPERIALVAVEPVEWPDAGLGCPQPGQTYAQVITPGYRVMLEVGRRQYELHTDRSGARVALCVGPVAGERIPLGRARSQEEIVALARQDLAGRLGVAVETVVVVSVERQEWEDECMACPGPPCKCPARACRGPLPGYRILLAVAGVQYEYRSVRLWLVFWGVAGN